MSRTPALAIAALMTVAFTACGNEGGGTPSGSEGAETTEATDETADAPEEEKSACLGKKKGPVTKVLAGKQPTGSSFGTQIRFFPEKLRLPAGKFVTLHVVWGAGPTHTLTIDSIDCDSGFLTVGDDAFISFKVPKGTTPFYCVPHESVGMKGKIVSI